MQPHRISVEPGAVAPFRRYWLRMDGVAFEVSDHLTAARYAQAESTEYVRPMRWGYDDMFRHGWMRIHTEQGRMWADGAEGWLATPAQQGWIDRAKLNLQSSAGHTIEVASALQSQTPVLGSGANTSPTRQFLRQLGLLRRKGVHK